MIRFELNNPDTFRLTTDQLMAIADIVDRNWSISYDVVESDEGATPHVKLWVHHEEGNPTRIWIGEDGVAGLSEEVDWDWKGEGEDETFTAPLTGHLVPPIPVTDYRFGIAGGAKYWLICKHHPENAYRSKNPWTRSLFVVHPNHDCACPMADLLVTWAPDDAHFDA